MTLNPRMDMIVITVESSWVPMSAYVLTLIVASIGTCMALGWWWLENRRARHLEDANAELRAQIADLREEAAWAKIRDGESISRRLSPDDVVTMHQLLGSCPFNDHCNCGGVPDAHFPERRRHVSRSH